MTLFFPDVNIWLALAVTRHTRRDIAWEWLNHLPQDARLVFARYTQLGFLRLLTNTSVMGEHTLTIRKAWAVYDQWLDDPRIEFYPEPRHLDAGFREATAPFGSQLASKAVGDCFLLAYAKEIGATLVTFDRALYALSRKQNCSAVIPA